MRPWLLTFVFAAVVCGAAGCAEPSAEGAEGAPAAPVATAEDDLASRACQTDRERPACLAQAVVEEVFIGEVDPHVIGDACIVFAREASGRLVGLVEDPGSCLATPELVGKEGTPIRFHRGDVLRITRPSLRNGLRALRADATYYDLLGPLSQSW